MAPRPNHHAPHALEQIAIPAGVAPLAAKLSQPVSGRGSFPGPNRTYGGSPIALMRLMTDGNASSESDKFFWCFLPCLVAVSAVPSVICRSCQSSLRAAVHPPIFSSSFSSSITHASTCSVSQGHGPSLFCIRILGFVHTVHTCTCSKPWRARVSLCPVLAVLVVLLV